MERKLSQLTLIVALLCLTTFPISSKENDIRLPPPPASSDIAKGVVIDVNNNQVRDDIEHFIYSKATKVPALYKLYLQFAIELDLMMKNEKDSKLAMNHQENTVLIQDCLFKLQGSKNSNAQVENLTNIKLMYFNTKEKKLREKSLIDKIGYPIDFAGKKESYKCTL